VLDFPAPSFFPLQGERKKKGEKEEAIGTRPREMIDEAGGSAGEEKEKGGGRRENRTKPLRSSRCEHGPVKSSRPALRFPASGGGKKKREEGQGGRGGRVGGGCGWGVWLWGRVCVRGGG